jgi:hypothetical protein
MTVTGKIQKFLMWDAVEAQLGLKKAQTAQMKLRENKN